MLLSGRVLAPCAEAYAAAKQKTSAYTISAALICVCLVICCHCVVIFSPLLIYLAAIVGSNCPALGS